jgi:type IV pilus assembly protein PilC
MASFQYRAVQSNGAVVEGAIDASSRQQAYSQLEGRGLNTLGLSEKKNGAAASKATGKSSASGPARGSVRVPFRALEAFTRQLASLLAAGVTLARALHILGREAASPSAKECWKAVHDLVIDGAALADAMRQFPQTFPRVYIAMVTAGETGGFLDVVLGQIADFQTREKELRGKVMAALIYPCVLMVLAICVLIFLLVFFIPRFTTIFEGFGAQLPLLTRAIVKSSEILTKYGVFVALGIGLAVFLIRQWLSTDQGRRAWEHVMLKLPVIGPLSARFAMTRFCRMLGTLVGAGVPLINALRVARQSIGNQTLVDAVSVSIDRVKQGERLAGSLSDCDVLFPGSVLEMISIAEETGRLDEELVRLATVAEGDLDRQLKTSVALAEPLMLFLMAGFIGTIFVGMVIPIFTIQDYIK